MRSKNNKISHVEVCLNHLISSLTQGEARLFKKYWDTKGSSKPYGYINLFQDIKNGVKTDVIYERNFQEDRKKFLTTCNYLLSRILEKLAVKHYQSINLAFEVAFQRGLIKVGVKLLAKRLEIAWQEKKILDVFSLTKRAIAIEKAYRIQTSIPDSLPSIQAIGEEVELQAKAVNAYREIKKHIGGTAPLDKIQSWRNWLESVPENLSFPSSQIAVLDCRMLIFRLLNQYFPFFELLEEKTRIFQENPNIYSFEEKITHFSRGIKTSLIIGDRTKAMHYLYLLENSERTFKRMDHLRLKLRVFNRLILALCLNNFSLAKMAIGDLSKNREFFQQPEHSMIYYLAVLFHILREDWEGAVKHVSTLKKLDRTNHFSSVIPFIRAICAYELGAKKRGISELNCPEIEAATEPYNCLLRDGFRKILLGKNQLDEVHRLKWFLSELETYHKQKPYDPAAMLFDPRGWLRANIEGVSIPKSLLSNSETLFRMREVS